MRVSRAFLTLALVVVGLVGGLSRAASPDQEKIPPYTNFPRVTRVLYLQGMTVDEAQKMLRTQLPISRIATLGNRGSVRILHVGKREKDYDECREISSHVKILHCS